MNQVSRHQAPTTSPANPGIGRRLTGLKQPMKITILALITTATVAATIAVAACSTSTRNGGATSSKTTEQPTVASASPYTSLVGNWSGHHRGLTVSADGTIELEIPDYPACPACSGAQMPNATIHIGLTGYNGKADGTPDGSGKFFGYVKDSSDTRVVPASVPVEVDVMNASDYRYGGGPPGYTGPGRVVTVSINGDHGVTDKLGDQVPFCDRASALKGVCGA